MSKDASTELRKFWVSQSKEFSTWFLLKSAEERRAVLVKAGGSTERGALPEAGPSPGAELTPTDLLLPELTLNGLLAGDGRSVA